MCRLNLSLRLVELLVLSEEVSTDILIWEAPHSTTLWNKNHHFSPPETSQEESCGHSEPGR